MKDFLRSLVVFLVVTMFSPLQISATDYTSVMVGYQTETLSGWSEYAYGGALSGSEAGNELKSVSLHLEDAVLDAKIEYRVYTSKGWQTWVNNYALAGDGTSILGLQVRLKDFPNANVYYQSYRKGLGWGIWVKNGATSGKLNASYPITGIRVKVTEIGVSYQSSSNGVNLIKRSDAETLGSGKLETLKMSLVSKATDDHILYRAYFKNTGWSGWAKDGALIGKTGSKAVIEAIEAKLENMPDYHVAIQPYVEGSGWWDWVYDGATAGSIGTPLSAYRIKIEKTVVLQQVETQTNTVSSEVTYTDFSGIGENPNETTLTYSAGSDATIRSSDVRLLAGIAKPLTANAIFDDNPAGVTIAVGDQFTAKLINFKPGDKITAPNEYQWDQANDVSNMEFAAFYGNYVDDVFTVTATPDIQSDALGKLVENTIIPSKTTHTLILFDNDTRQFISLTDSGEGGGIMYLGSQSDYTYDSSTLTGQVVYKGVSYNLKQFKVSDGEGGFNKYIGIDGYTFSSKTNEFTSGTAVDQVIVEVEGISMNLDGFVVEGVLNEINWSHPITNGYLEYNVPQPS
jgi:uncharacterized protein YjdB